MFLKLLALRGGAETTPVTPSNPSSFLLHTNPSRNTQVAPAEGKTHQDAGPDKTLWTLQSCKLRMTFLTYRWHTVNLCKLPRLFPRCNTICHRSAPSFVRQMVAVQCSQTSGGISSPGYKLKQWQALSSPPQSLEPENTLRRPPFSTHYVRAQRERVQLGRCQPGEWWSFQCAEGGQGSGDVFLYCVHWDLQEHRRALRFYWEQIVSLKRGFSVDSRMSIYVARYVFAPKGNTTRKYLKIPSTWPQTHTGHHRTHTPFPHKLAFFLTREDLLVICN